jgi:deoxyribose-phosphate aldolase
MQLADTIEHTALAANLTREAVERLCAEAVAHRFHGVCVAPLWVAHAARGVQGSRVRVVSVAGFPLGATTTAVKVEEARQIVGDGALEVDMVMPIGAAIGGDWTVVREDIRSVRRAAAGATLKVIVETGYLDTEQIASAAEISVDEGADFVKTCTGFGPRGATVQDVALLCRGLRGRAAVKASGGIRTRDDAQRMISAGATRIGTSAGVAIVSTAL